MITNYKNILLKDGKGNALLPITLSYYVEYKSGESVKAKLDSLDGDIVNINSYINGINDAIADNGEVQERIIDSINSILDSYVLSPDYASKVVFDNTVSTLSDEVKALENDATENGVNFVSTQKVIETIDARISSNVSYINGVKDDIDGLKTIINSYGDTLTEHDGRLDQLEADVITYATAIDNIKEDLYTDGELDINASAVKYDGAGTAYTSSAQNVQDAIEALDTQVGVVSQMALDVSQQAGVTSVTGTTGILVMGGNQQTPAANTAVSGPVTLSLDSSTVASALVDGVKIIKDENNKITVDESELSIDGSQITGYISADQIDGGLGADNINITYIDNSGAEPVEGEKSVQEFYNETQTTISEIQTSLDDLTTSYVVSLADDGGESSYYARVYTLSQGGQEIGTINIPKDQFLKSVQYAYAADGVTPALVFNWQLPNEDSDEGDTTYVPISDFIDAITGEIATDVEELKTDVENLETSVSAIESSYITGATINGNEVQVDNHILQLSYVALYEEGNQTEPANSAWLESLGINLNN